MILTTIAVLIYCAIGYCFHRGVLKEYANDKSYEMNQIPPALVKTVLFLCSIFWPFVIIFAIVESVIRKEDM